MTKEGGHGKTSYLSGVRERGWEGAVWNRRAISRVPFCLQLKNDRKGRGLRRRRVSFRPDHAKKKKRGELSSNRGRDEGKKEERVRP